MDKQYKQYTAIYRYYEDEGFATLSIKADDGWWHTFTLTQEMFDQINRRREDKQNARKEGVTAADRV